MSQVLELLTLQEIDDEAAALMATLEAVRARLRGNPELEDAGRRLQYVNQRLKSIRARQRRTEAQIEDLNARIAPEEKRLYDGSIHVPRELESLQKELAFLVSGREKLEEELLRELTEVEDLEGQRKAAEHRIVELEGDWNARRDELQAEAGRLEEKLREIGERRDFQRGQLKQSPLSLYEDLRRRKGGVAVAPIRAGACSACRVALPGAMRSRLMASDAIVQCPNCERILSVG